jgi:hypothetical protein
LENQRTQEKNLMHHRHQGRLRYLSKSIKKMLGFINSPLDAKCIFSNEINLSSKMLILR